MPARDASARADLFRLLGDEDRLRLLALCEAEELTVGELALLLDASQPQVTRKTQPLRDAGLLHERRDGTRILLRAEVKRDPVVAAALEAGRSLCLTEGQLAKVPAVMAQREETSRRFFAQEKPRSATQPSLASEEPLRALLPFLSLLAPLLPGHALAVDVGTGEGALLPLFSAARWDPAGTGVAEPFPRVARKEVVASSPPVARLPGAEGRGGGPARVEPSAPVGRPLPAEPSGRVGRPARAGQPGRRARQAQPGHATSTAPPTHRASPHTALLAHSTQRTAEISTRSGVRRTRPRKTSQSWPQEVSPIQRRKIRSAPARLAPSQSSTTSPRMPTILPNRRQVVG